MFGLQAPALLQKLRGATSFEGLANNLVDIIGNCERELEHQGRVTLNGPTELNGPVRLEGDVTRTSTTPVNITVTNAETLGEDEETPTDFHDASQLLGDLAAVVILSFIRIGTLAGTLARDGTQTLTALAGGNVTVSGHFVPTGLTAPSGARCLGLKWEGTWYAILIDQCAT